MNARPGAMLALLAIAAVQTGCVATIGRQEYLARNLAPKAAFDLQCPEGQLQFMNLGPASADFYFTDYLAAGPKPVHVTDTSEQQGVTGCGKRGRYVFSGMGWVMNAESGAAAPSTMPPQKESARQ